MSYAHDKDYHPQEPFPLPKGSSFVYYRAAKVMAEDIVAKYADDTGIPTSIVRIGYVPAPEKRTKEQEADVGRIFSFGLANRERLAIVS